MARNDRGFYHLPNTARGFVPAIVVAQYDTNGDVVADGASGEASDVTSVDVLLLGYQQAWREGVTVGTGANEFEFTDTLAS